MRINEYNDNAPILAIDQIWDRSEQKYPGLYVTRRIGEDDDGNAGREYFVHYPDPYTLGSDDDGMIALNFGAEYYNEGMSYFDFEDHDARVDCFRAAELLYLHSAEKGNPIASLNLGYVYSYNRCEGQFFRDASDDQAADGCNRPYPRYQRAFECYKVAAEADIAEGCFKLGDMYRSGTGCEPDAGKAFSWYVRASELADNEEPVIWGSVALRLGSCYENGFGCAQSFERAAEWYGRAETGLEIAVRSGDWYYEKALANARAGASRARQELSL